LRCYDARSKSHSDGAGIEWSVPTDSPYLDAPVRSAGNLLGWVRFEPREDGRSWTAEEHTFAGAVADLVARAIDAAERRTLEQELARVQRMDSIGQLAGGIAHDFNNILTAILGNLEYCRAELPKGHPLDGGLAEAEDAARRAADLTRQLLAFARHQVVEARVLDLNAVTRDADRMMRRLVGAAIEMRTRLEPTLHATRIAPSQIEQVMVNLVVNARDAMPDGGRITIETRNVTVDAAFTADHPEIAPGEYVALSVADTGLGMDRATAERVFEPFFTTKQVGKGTGLGLAVCYGIVRQAGGVVTVDSAPGAGATFTVYLPAVQTPVEEAVPGARAQPKGGHETLLVVEDDGPIRGLLARALATRGYRVLEAADGEQAVAVARQHDGAIALLLTDVVMPRVSGPETARRVRDVCPGIPVIYMSGYTADALADSAAVEAEAFLSKPFTPDEAARLVRAVLDGPKLARPSGPIRAS
jgi:signal transduction histidine kinase/ActR/RegA family two-component response regulator